MRISARKAEVFLFRPFNFNFLKCCIVVPKIGHCHVQFVYSH